MEEVMRVKMTKDALENYGKEWEGVALEIISSADKYMPAKEFYAKGQPTEYHPGYDTDVGGVLYELCRADNGEMLSFSLYDWEVEEI